jgi:hypothetical protein
VDRLEDHREATERALVELGMGWEGWPAITVDRRLAPEDRLSALLLLLATSDMDGERGVSMTWIDPAAPELDWLGRAREPWTTVARLRFPWTAPTATIALEAVAGGSYDDRRVAIALRGASQVCSAGLVDTALVQALDTITAHLDASGDHEWRIVELRNQARRVTASATHPEILDLSLLADGDAWVGPAREVALSLPADDIAPMVRLLGDLGPRRPAQRWWRSVDEALVPTPARQLLRRWLELAAATAVVPEWPGSKVGYCAGALFVGTNVDVVRAAVLTTSRLQDEAWPTDLLADLARRGSAHNGMAGIPEALALKVASAAVDALVLRANEVDHAALAGLLTDLHRRDLIRRINAALP